MADPKPEPRTEPQEAPGSTLLDTSAPKSDEGAEAAPDSYGWGV